MKDKHTKISGYRELNQEEIDLMNRIKAFGPELEKLCMDLQEYIGEKLEKAETEARKGNDSEYRRLMQSAPYM